MYNSFTLGMEDHLLEIFGGHDTKEILSAGLSVDKEEAEIIVGIGEIPELAKRLKLPTMDTVVITDGQKGASCYDGKTIYSIKPAKKLKIKEKVINSIHSGL